MKREILTQIETVTLGEGLCNPLAKGDVPWEKPIKNAIIQPGNLPDETIEKLIDEYQEIADKTRDTVLYERKHLAFTALPSNYFELRMNTASSVTASVDK